MEDPVNKKKSSSPASLGEEQIRFHADHKESIEDLHGQAVLKDILTPKDTEKPSITQEEIFQISFEELGKRSLTETVDLQSVPPLPEWEDNKEEAPIEMDSASLIEGSLEIESLSEGHDEEQIRFQSSDAAPSGTPGDSRSNDKQKEMPEQTFQETVGEGASSYQQTPSTSSIFRLRQGTRRAFVVLKDIFGDIETDSAASSYDSKTTSEKKKLPAIFLCLLLGVFGAHRLYLGHYKKAPLYFLTLAFCWMSLEFLPDMGLSNLLMVIITLWIIADVLALIFSRRILDDQGNILREWI